jgi:ubiquinone/menaquinone biosynthesis C-methylase UbiE
LAMKTEEKRVFFNRLASSWDEMTQSQQIASAIRDFVQRSFAAGARTILDVGCGTGVLVPHLLSAYPRTRIFIELDFAEEMLAVNRMKFADRRLVRLAGDATDLQLPDDSMDVILCFNAAPHLGHGETAFHDLFRVLAPGGIIAVGHLMNSAELNQFHRSVHGPVAHDHLPPAQVLGRIFSSLGGKDVLAQERPGWYFVRASKPA